MSVTPSLSSSVLPSDVNEVTESEMAKSHTVGPKSDISGPTSVMLPLSSIIMREEDRVRPVEKDGDHYKQLKYSMETSGQFTPIGVIPDSKEPGKYRVWTGHHRVTAAQELQWTEIEAKVGKFDEKEMSTRQLQANFQKAMSPFEQAKVIKQLLGRQENWGRTYTEVLVESGFATTPNKAQWLLKQMGLTNLIEPARVMMEVAGSDRGEGLPLSYAVILAKFPHDGPVLSLDDDGNVKSSGETKLQEDWFNRFKTYHDRAQWGREANQYLEMYKKFKKGQKVEKDQFTGSHRRKDSEFKNLILDLQKAVAEEVPQSFLELSSEDQEAVRKHFLLEGTLWAMHMDEDSVREREELAAMKHDEREKALAAKKDMSKAVQKMSPEKLDAMKKAFFEATGEELVV